MEMSLEAEEVPNVCESVCFVCYCQPKQNVLCLNVVLTASVSSLKGWVEDFRSVLCILYILNIIFELQGEFVLHMWEAFLWLQHYRYHLHGKQDLCSSKLNNVISYGSLELCDDVFACHDPAFSLYLPFFLVSWFVWDIFVFLLLHLANGFVIIMNDATCVQGS